jgi:activating signal cointegrator complex subunit 3
MLDVSADHGWLVASLQVIHLIQMVIQAAWWHKSTLLTLPHIQTCHLYCFRTATNNGHKLISSLPELIHAIGGSYDKLRNMTQDEFTTPQLDQLFAALTQLPEIDVRLSIRGWWAGRQNSEQERTISHGGLRNPNDAWMPVHADQEYILNVNLSRLNRLHKRDSKAYAPKFPKSKDEGWILVLGEIETQEVIALKRIGYVRSKSKIPLSFYTPEVPGRVIYTLYVMSDSYLGLDQQYDMCLQVQESSLEAQVNTELAGEFSDLDL